MTEREVWASALLWLGLLMLVVALVPRWRRRAWRFGAILLVVAVAIPPKLRQVTAPESWLDDLQPRYQFSEQHALLIPATQDRVDRALRAVTAGEIRYFGFLTMLRRLGRPGRESLLNVPPDKPVLDVATRTTFTLLANEPGCEIVMGAHLTPGIQATMNFRMEEATRGHTWLTTETRVYAADWRSERLFAIYWRFILPGSALIRVEWLDAIRRRTRAT